MDASLDAGVAVFDSVAAEAVIGVMMHSQKYSGLRRTATEHFENLAVAAAVFG